MSRGVGENKAAARAGIFRLGLGTALAMALGFWLAGASLALAASKASPSSGGRLAQAQVEGKWQVTVTVTGYHGGKPTGLGASRNAIGHSASGVLWLQEKCSATGSCTLVIWGPGGPGDEGTGLTDVEDSTNFTVPSSV
jgi:hypothetical protein